MNSGEETTFWEEIMFVNKEMRLLELWSVMGKMVVGYCTLVIVLQIQGDFPSYVIVTSFYGGGDRLTPQWRPPKYISP